MEKTQDKNYQIQIEYEITKLRKMKENPRLKKEDLIYPDLSYKIIGIAFEIGKQLGFGHKEKFYEKAISKAFENNSVKFKEQLPVKLKLKDEIIGIYYFDFLIEDKIVLELKTKNYFSGKDIKQVYQYLKAKDLKLGIIIHFTNDGVKFKRVLNIL